MSGLPQEEITQLQNHLQQAVVACNDRCLYNSAKWAAELLNSFSDAALDLNPESDTDVESSVDEDTEPQLPPLSGAFSDDPREARLEKRELPRFLMAKSCFDCRDKYIAGEKRKDEDSEMVLGPLDGPITLNKELNTISAILNDYFEERGGINGTQPSQGFLEYLYGIILMKNKNDIHAKQWLLRSVNLYCYNWGAWQELAGLIGSLEELTQISQQLPRNIMAFMFHIHCSQELYQNTEQIHNTISQMVTIFPYSAFLQTQRALLHYHAKDFDEADRLFTHILSSYPYRLDSLDTYSNILYVMDARPKLAYLASVASATDKFRPETCCIVGNYYSLSSAHEKAVIYFRRALALDRHFLSAWTLMGHEYIELKNTQAAIESYRRAIDANRKDYRAWYGLGQGYEIMDMHSYAIFYYQRAAALQSWDPKMWMAVANAFAHCGKLTNAIRAYKRALQAGSYIDPGGSFASSSADPLANSVGGALDPEILYQIALLYERDNNIQEAAAYMDLTLAQEEGPDEEDLPPGARVSGGVGVTQTTSKARMWLAKWCFHERQWQRAAELANELCQDGVEVEEAKALIRDVRARLGAETNLIGQEHVA
ncbi:Anaphase-promoting complex subunit 8 [Taxawa tesnikishii (nom. ined.)]|nr:Anaphase-promoting complex subunit 8 [Dothideales sp. JES 119]